MRLLAQETASFQAAVVFFAVDCWTRSEGEAVDSDFAVIANSSRFPGEVIWNVVLKLGTVT